ncbi:MAG: hypothetical protein N838_30480 [Thiohalocapsa sp. PB-PSB1]|jgi:hypothetical protein|nr:MAG: hypothetical protein N838_30480 [Thiohalocapsa sp. PB-PSB1]
MIFNHSETNPMTTKCPTRVRFLTLAITLWLLLFSQCLWALADGNDVDADQDLNYVFDVGALPEIFIKVAEAEWNRLVQLYDRNYRNEDYVQADFYWKKGDEPTQAIKTVGIRVSGNTNRRRPQGGDNIYDIRPFNFKIDFNEFVDDDDHEFHDQKGLKFKAAGDDFGDTDQDCRAEPVCEGSAITRTDNGGRSVSDIVVEQTGTYVVTFNDKTYAYRFARIEDGDGDQ